MTDNPQAGTRQKIIVLGNCVANRLAGMLAKHPGFAARYDMISAPMIHTLRHPAQWEKLALTARACDLVLTQPLFRFGPCNTAALASVMPRERLIVFPSPNFEAYFPDVMFLDGKTDLRFSPILDWDSRIIFSCYVAKVPIFDVEAIYRHHPLFRKKNMETEVEKALTACVRRDQDTNAPIAGFIKRYFAASRLFHSWQHPTTPLLTFMLSGLLATLNLPLDGRQTNRPRQEVGAVQNGESADLSSLFPPDAAQLTTAVESFGFNQWPILNGHGLYRFAEEACFRIGGREVSLEDAAMTFYNFYEFHPHVVERNIDKAAAL